MKFKAKAMGNQCVNIGVDGLNSQVITAFAGDSSHGFGVDLEDVVEHVEFGRFHILKVHAKVNLVLPNGGDYGIVLQNLKLGIARRSGGVWQVGTPDSDSVGIAGDGSRYGLAHLIRCALSRIGC